MSVVNAAIASNAYVEDTSLEVCTLSSTCCALNLRAEKRIESTNNTIYSDSHIRSFRGAKRGGRNRDLGATLDTAKPRADSTNVDSLC